MWEWFWELDRSRQYGFGPNPLSYSDIVSWSFLNSTEPKPWELNALIAMDRVRVEWLAKPEKEKTVKATTENVKAVFGAMAKKPGKKK